ncbi:hypothetical protein CDAR_552851 [Caerostris darwini]|uniref:Uncharacterized protein n=1 Tax=Caerostris darwini TaxID=1538125 RepID=A0AAV4MNR7_9ARAC|nr:hypothetical protein CDAR_552851 [Caerostris darwini]
MPLTTFWNEHLSNLGGLYQPPTVQPKDNGLPHVQFYHMFNLRFHHGHENLRLSSYHTISAVCKSTELSTAYIMKSRPPRDSKWLSSAYCTTV